MEERNNVISMFNSNESNSFDIIGLYCSIRGKQQREILLLKWLLLLNASLKAYCLDYSRRWLLEHYNIIKLTDCKNQTLMYF